MSESAMSRVGKLIEDFERKKKELEESVRANLKDVFAEFFNAYPDVKTINWLQYVPYFNDGDECVFNIYDINFSTLSKAEVIDEGTTGFSCSYGNELSCYYCTDADEKYVEKLKNTDAQLYFDMVKDAKVITNFVESVSDFMQAICGSHAFIIIDREGITVEDYSDHD